VVSGDASRASSGGATVSGQFSINHLGSEACACAMSGHLSRAEEAPRERGANRRGPAPCRDKLSTLHSFVDRVREVFPGLERDSNRLATHGRESAT
jgi:hypothetical protein